MFKQFLRLYLSDLLSETRKINLNALNLAKYEILVNITQQLLI